MLVKHVTREQLEETLAEVNEQFDGNIVFKRLQPARGHNRWNVTLTVKDSRGPGGRLGHSGRRISAACWHAYGTFFDNLPEQARYVAPVVVGYDNWGREKTRRQECQPGDPWQDWNIGSVMSPLYYSEACKCDE